MKEYSNAEAYYRYAKGMLAFDQGDYPTVIDNMTELTIQGENVIADYAPASYLAFAWGMQYLKEEDYDNAYIELGSISSGALASKHYYQRFTAAMKECKQGIKETHLRTVVCGAHFCDSRFLRTLHLYAAECEEHVLQHPFL